MSDPLQLTPDGLESLLADRDVDDTAAFVADLYRLTGRDTTRDGRVVTVSGQNGDSQRLLVWVDDRGQIGRLLGRDPPTADAEAVDAVVTTRQDAVAGTTVAADLGADHLDTDDLHGRLLYGMDRDVCRDLCAEHFGRPVDPQPAPEESSEEPVVGGFSRPRFALAVVVVCGLLVAGAAGLPGPGTPEKIPLVPGNGTETPGTPGAGPLTPVGGRGTTPTVTFSPDTPTPPVGGGGATPTITQSPDTLPPRITGVTATDLEDGDGVVSEGDLVAVRAAITDNQSGTGRADAFPGAFGVEGPLPMTDTDADGVYNTTFRVNATRAAGDGNYPIGIGAIDEAGNVNIGQVFTNGLSLNTSEA